MSPIYFIKEANNDVWGASMVCIYIIYQYENKEHFMSMLYYLIFEIYRYTQYRIIFYITTYVIVMIIKSSKTYLLTLHRYWGFCSSLSVY